jgi:hypothetical protein
MKYFTHAKAAISLICFILVVNQLAGCASAAKSTAMTTKDIEVQQRHPYSVQVQVSGGHDTGALDTTQISNEAFAEALLTSIDESKLFAETKEDGDADYLLHVTLLDLEQPTFGASMTVNMEAAWALINNDTRKTIWKKSIKSQYTAGAFDAFAGVTRIRLATEGAARNNINKGILLLSELNL